MDEFDPRDRAVARFLAETPVQEDPAAWERARVAYRHSRTARRAQRGPLFRRGMRLATVSTVSVLLGSLASGYAAALPDPVQRAAHHILGRVGLPAPHHQHKPAPARRTPTPVLSPHHAGAHRATPALRHRVAIRAHPAGPRLLLADHGLEPAGSATIATVTVTTTHRPPGARVELQTAMSRTGPWRDLAAREPDHAGRMSFPLPSFAHNTWLRAVDDSIASAPQLLVVTPTISASWSHSSDGRATLHLTVRGAARGETVTVSDLSHKGATTTSARLDRHGKATISFTVPPGGGDRLTARIAATATHGATTATLPGPPTL